MVSIHQFYMQKTVGRKFWMVVLLMDTVKHLEVNGSCTSITDVFSMVVRGLFICFIYYLKNKKIIFKLRFNKSVTSRCNIWYINCFILII